MNNTQQQKKLCERILTGMKPVIRAYHTNRWVQNREREALPPRGELELYRLYLARKKR
jgi:hypothetical protein